MIRLDHVTVDYPSRPGILNTVSLHVPAGAFRFVTGPSGAGKTTLLKLLFMGLSPTAGKLELFGRNVMSLSRDQRAILRSRMGVVFQDFRLIDHMTVYDNVALPLRVTGKDGGTLRGGRAAKARGRRGRDRHRQDGSAGDEALDRDYVRELLHWVGLGDQAQSFPAELSGGQKQRVAIARAVINRPTLLLADEPTGNVDDGIGLKLIRLFEELNKLGTTVVVATHSEAILERFPYPAFHLEQGQVQLQGTMQGTAVP